MDQEPKASTWQPLGTDPAGGGGVVWWKYQYISHLWVFGLLKPASTSWDFPGDSDSKGSAYNEGDPGSILGQEDLLEKEMATHSSIFAWKIPRTEEPGRLQSMGSQRVDMTYHEFLVLGNKFLLLIFIIHIIKFVFLANMH